MDRPTEPIHVPYHRLPDLHCCDVCSLEEVTRSPDPAACQIWALRALIRTPQSWIHSIFDYSGGGGGLVAHPPRRHTTGAVLSSRCWCHTTAGVPAMVEQWIEVRRGARPLWPPHGHGGRGGGACHHRGRSAPHYGRGGTTQP
jgi:hypothetical protein